MTATDLDTRTDAPLISLADFHILLADQHPFSLLGIDVLRIGTAPRAPCCPRATPTSAWAASSPGRC